jgi:hypothetical protein
MMFGGVGCHPDMLIAGTPFLAYWITVVLLDKGYIIYL